jgi:hypothetical protein
MNRLLIYSTLLLFLQSFPLAPVGAQEQFETLDAGTLPARSPVKPAPFDWRGEAPPGDALTRIAELAKRRPASDANRSQLRRLRRTLRPPFSPPEDVTAFRRRHEATVASVRRSNEGTAGSVGPRGMVSIQSLPAPEAGHEAVQVKASPVYLKDWLLTAGRQYTIETRGLSAGSDSVLYVLRDGRQVAMNNDRGAGDRSSRVRFTPDTSGAHVLLIRALNEATAGTCDLYIDGQSCQQGIEFGGTTIHWPWEPGDRFQTAHLPSTYAVPVDTLLFAFEGLDLVAWNDDGGIRGCSALTPAVASQRDDAQVLVASYAPDEPQSEWVMLYRNQLSQPDTDGDTLSDILEASLGTNPESADTDGDGLRDDWELLGVRTPAGEEDLPAYAGTGLNKKRGSDPKVRDLFLEIDWIAGPKDRPHLYRPMDAAIDLITRQFWQSGGIALHVDMGQMGTSQSRGGQSLPYQESFDRTGTEPLSLESCYQSSDWFAASRRHLFAYLICGSRFPDRNSSGHMVRFNEDGSINQTALFNSTLQPAAIVCMGTSINGSLQMEAGTIMHELGHCLNLQHGGFESYVNFKPNYVSSMNYLFQFNGLDGDGAPDYSHGGRPTLDERQLDETAGIGPSAEQVYRLLTRGRTQPAISRRSDVRCEQFPDAFDWNGDDAIGTGLVRADYNSDGFYGLLRDNDDWAEVRRPDRGLYWVGLNAGIKEWVSVANRP